MAMKHLAGAGITLVTLLAASYLLPIRVIKPKWPLSLEVLLPPRHYIYNLKHGCWVLTVLTRHNHGICCKNCEMF